MLNSNMRYNRFVDVHACYCVYMGYIGGGCLEHITAIIISEC